MAEAVAGGDTKQLFKMMERGELDPNKVLPVFFDLLGKKAEPFMEDYYKTLLYQRRRYEVAEEQWFKDFMKGGAEDGMTFMFNSLSSLMESVGGTAEGLGSAVKRASAAVSLIPIASRDLSDWIKGVGFDRPNLFRDFLGAPPDVGIIIDPLKDLGTAVGDLVTELTPAASAIASFAAVVANKALDLGAEGAVGGLGFLETSVRFATKAMQGDVTGGAVEVAAKRESKRLVDRNLSNQGIDPTTYDWKHKNELVKEMYPTILEQISKQRAEMGSARGLYFDLVENMPLVPKPRVVHFQTINKFLGNRVLDVMDLPNLFTGSDFGKVDSATYVSQLRGKLNRDNYSISDLEFLSKNPELASGYIQTVKGREWDRDAQQWNEYATIINNYIYNNEQDRVGNTRFPVNPYGDTSGHSLIEGINSPRLNITMPDSKPIINVNVPSNNQNQIQGSSKVVNQNISLTPLLDSLPNNIQQNSPVFITQPAPVYENKTENNFTINNTVNAEVADMDRIADFIQENNESLAASIAAKVGGGIN